MKQGRPVLDRAASSVLNSGLNAKPYAAGVQTYCGARPGNKTMRLHVILEDGLARIYANNCVAFRKTFKLDKPAGLTLFAEGGEAFFKKVDVWELKLRAKSK